MFTILGMNQVTPPIDLLSVFTKYVCTNNVTNAICSNLIFLFTGYDAKQLNEVIAKYVISTLYINI